MKLHYKSVGDMEGRIFRSKTTDNFTVIKNEILDRTDLSWAAKGLLSYLLRLPHDWVVYKSHILKQSNIGKDALNTIWKELEDARYIISGNQRNEGRFRGRDFIVFDIPADAENLPSVAENPHRKERKIRIGTVAENPHLLNTYNTTKKETNVTPASQVMTLFNEINKKYEPHATGLKETKSRVSAINNRKREFEKAFAGADFLKACGFVFEYKAKEWHGTDMWKYFEIDTLMRESNFIKYCEQAKRNKGKPPEKKNNNLPEQATTTKSAFKNWNNESEE